MNTVEFELIQTRYPKNFPLNLLLLADPSIKNIESYITNSFSYLVVFEKQIIGILVLSEIDKNNIEIKNIAIKESFQNRGFAKQTLQFASKIATQNNYKKLYIATANSSILQLGLYQRQGFEIYKINFNFFLNNYSEPIIENGIICKHQICLEKNL